MPWSKSGKKGPARFVLAALVAAAVSLLTYTATRRYFQSQIEKNGSQTSSASPSGTSEIGEGGIHQLRKTSESFRSIAKRVGPAVVNIRSTKGAPKGRGTRGLRRNRRGQMPDDEEQTPFHGDPFYDFFERFGQQFSMPQDVPQTSLGSGIIVDSNGIIVTNNHVIEDGSEIVVTLANEKTDIKAKVIGNDPKSDLAVLKLESGSGYPVAEWADSDAVEVGDWAIAIGSPFDLGNSVTLGIVSAKGRNAPGLTGSEYSGDLIQTDAAINPGNSGGPLCDLDGKVMGVNQAILTRSGGYMGIGFAIPSNLAKDVVNRLIKEGKIVRGWLGVYIQPIDPEMAKDLGVKQGAAIHEVVPASPAEAAGLAAGDVVVELDGKPIKDASQLQKLIGNYKPGQSIKIKVISYEDKKTKTVSVKIGTLPDKDAEGGAAMEEPDKLGITVSSTKGGVVVESIQPGSFAEQQLGLEVGDILLRINRTNIDSVAAYKRLVNASKQIALEISRKGRTLFFRFSAPE